MTIHARAWLAAWYWRAFPAVAYRARPAVSDTPVPREASRRCRVRLRALRRRRTNRPKPHSAARRFPAQRCVHVRARRVGKLIFPRRDAVFRLPARRVFGRFFQRQRIRRLLLEHADHALIDKIVHQPRLVEPHFMLGGMHVDIHLVRVDFQMQHIRRLLIDAELIFAGLANRVVDQPIAHHAAIHVAILNFGKRRRGAFRLRHPAAQRQIAVLPLNSQRLLKKGGAANRAKTTFARRVALHRPVLAHHFAVVAEVNRHVKARQRDAPHHFVNVGEFGFLGAHKLARAGVL